MNDLDLNDVRTFVAVAHAGTLTACSKGDAASYFYGQPGADST